MTCGAGGWFPSEADLETKMGMQVIYLGGDPRKHQEGVGCVGQGKDGKLIQDVAMTRLPHGKLGISPAGDF